MPDFITQLHFLRPLWLLLIPLIPIAYYLQGLKKSSPWLPYIAPHFIQAFTVGATVAQRRNHRSVVGLLLLVWVIALAGPSGKKIATPFSQNEATLIIALELSQDMLKTDLKPTRLSHAKLKIQSLLTQRGSAKTGLIVYAGSSHVVIPPTEDTHIIKLYLNDLQPDLMPINGRNLLPVRQQALQLLGSDMGQVLFVGSSADGQWPLADTAVNRSHNYYWQISATVPELPQIQAYTVDDRDTGAVLKKIYSNHQQVLAASGQQQWQDAGYFLVFPIALMVLLLYRRGGLR